VAQLGANADGEVLALQRPTTTYVREQLRQRLARQLGRAYRRWLHPTSGRCSLGSGSRQM